jgi:hypothetical protein
LKMTNFFRNVTSLLIKSEFSIFFFKLLVENLIKYTPYRMKNCIMLHLTIATINRSREKLFLNFPLCEKSYKTLLF